MIRWDPQCMKKGHEHVVVRLTPMLFLLILAWPSTKIKILAHIEANGATTQKHKGEISTAVAGASHALTLPTLNSEWRASIAAI